MTADNSGHRDERPDADKEEAEDGKHERPDGQSGNLPGNRHGFNRWLILVPHGRLTGNTIRKDSYLFMHANVAATE